MTRDEPMPVGGRVPMCFHNVRFFARLKRYTPRPRLIMRCLFFSAYCRWCCAQDPWTRRVHCNALRWDALAVSLAQGSGSGDGVSPPGSPDERHPDELNAEAARLSFALQRLVAAQGANPYA